MFNIKIIIGANYGDEGKGQMTDYFCNQAKGKGENCLVVCTNGGAQRGHTVVTPEGVRHVFQHFGSGTLCGADTYLPKYFIVNPLIFNKELNELNKKRIKPKVIINKKCKISTPFDMIANQLIEYSRGKNKNGSCGVGIWETILRYHNISCHNYLSKNYLTYLRDEYFTKRLKKYGIDHIPEEYASFYYSNALIENFITDLYEMLDYCEFVDNNEILKKYQNIVFENGQGLLLDQKYGKHSTPSNTGLINVQSTLKTLENEKKKIEACYVTRSYMTRHGNGPFKTECSKEEIGSHIVEDTNVYNNFQGKFRYGKIPLSLFIKEINKDRETMQLDKVSLAIMHLNETKNMIIGDRGNFEPQIFKPVFDELYLSNGKTRDYIKIWSKK